MAVIDGRNTTTKQKRTTWLFEEQKTVYEDLSPMAKWLAGSPSLPLIGQMFGRDTWTILPKSASPIQRRTYKDKQAPPRQQRPGYQDAKKALVACTSKYDKTAELL